MSLDVKYLEKTFIAHLDSLTAVLVWLRSYSSLTGLSDQEWNKVEIALEEALVNIIHHAYPKQDGWIFFSGSIIPHQKIEFIIKDMGKPFDPEKKPIQIPQGTSLEALPVGGLGLLFMREYMDEVHYERVDPYNVLTLVKFCQKV